MRVRLVRSTAVTRVEDDVDTTAPAAPTGLSNRSVTVTGFTTDWDSNSEPDLASYRVYRSTSEFSGYSLIQATTNTTYTHFGLIGGTTYYVKVTAVDNAGNESDFSTVVSETTQAAESSLTWGWDTPSLQNETDFYTNILGWSIPANADQFTESRYVWATGYSFGDVHNDTEGDNLWTWDQQFKRHGGGKLLKAGYDLTTHRANVLSTFKNTLLSELDADDGDSAPSGFGYDHMYGQGLATVYNDTGDADILTVLEGLKTRLQGRDEMQDLIAGTPIATATFLSRGFARWAIVAAYGYEAVGGAEWQELRDACVFGYETSTDWEEGGVIAAGGNCFASQAQQDTFDSVTNGGQWPHSTYRYNAGWTWALQNEAMWRLYVQTGNATLKDRLIKSARYIQHYIWDSSWVWPSAGERWGHNVNTGARANINGGDSGSESITADNCSFDVAMVNSLVIGYKLTGDTTLLTKAREVFKRGNRWDPGDGTTLWAPNINSAYLYVDISANPATDEFLFNKGQLQYCYMLFENGGSPDSALSTPTWYDALAANQANVFATSDWQSQLGPAAGTAGAERNDVAIFSYSGGVLNTEGLYDGTTFQDGPFLCLHGGGHGAYNGNEIAAFGPLNADSPDWHRTVDANPAGDNQSYNGNQPASQHSYSHLGYLKSVNKLMVPAITSLYPDSGIDHATSLFDFTVSDPDSNLTTAWSNSPTVPDIPPPATGASYGACGCYDEEGDAYYWIDGWGQTYVAKYDVQSNSWTRHPSSGSNSQVISYSDNKCCAIDPVTKVILVTSEDQAPWCLDARSPSSAFYQPGGSNRPIGTGGVLFDPVNRRWVYYAGGNTMWVCPVPTNPYSGGDNFNWTQVTITGDTCPTIPSHPGSGMYNRFQYCPRPHGYVACAGYNRDVVFIRAA